MAAVTHREHSSLGPLEGDLGDENTVDAHPVARHAKSPDVVWVEAVQGRCSVADTSDFRQFELAGPSAEVWSRIDGFASDDEVVRAVLATYPEHPDTAFAECVSLIETMTGLGLLVPQPDTECGEPDVDHPDRGDRVMPQAQKGTVE